MSDDEPTANTLPAYMGRPVLHTIVSITNAGDGLSQGMAIDPELLEPESTVYVALECKVDKHTHEVIDKVPGTWVLKQVLKAGNATIVSAEIVKEAIDARADEILKAKEEAAGVTRLDLEGNPPTDDGAGIQYGNPDPFDDIEDLTRKINKASRDALFTLADSKKLEGLADNATRAQIVEALFAAKISQGEISQFLIENKFTKAK